MVQGSLWRKLKWRFLRARIESSFLADAGWHRMSMMAKSRGRCLQLLLCQVSLALFVNLPRVTDKVACRMTSHCSFQAVKWSCGNQLVERKVVIPLPLKKAPDLWSTFKHEKGQAHKVYIWTSSRVCDYFSSLISDTSYTMSVKLGDVLSPDTNLYVQLFGEKGETSKIMLRPVGSSLNKFEKGRTYKFTVETVNIGKVSYQNCG